MFGTVLDDDRMKTMALGKVAKIDRAVATGDECANLPYVGLEHIEKERGHFADGFVPVPLNMLATNFRFTPKHVLYGKLRPYLNKVVCQALTVFVPQKFCLSCQTKKNWIELIYGLFFCRLLL
jgi:hypothetical protein